MERDKILSVVLGTLYYVISIIIFCCSYFINALFGVISRFSFLLFNICFLVFPIILLIIPIIHKQIYKKQFYKSIIKGIILIIIYIIILFIIEKSINIYFKSFTSGKWKNNNWHSFRYNMIDDLEQEYEFVGMNKNEVYEILGKSDRDGYDNSIMYIIKTTFFEDTYYCIYFNEDDKVVKIDIREIGIKDIG